MIKHLALFISFLAIFLVSCQEIIEPNITGEKINLLFPADSSLIKRMPIVFQWDELEGARNYRVQIGSPTVNRPSDLFLDTLVNDNKLKLTLPQGDYEWQVRGGNSEYFTEYSRGRFKIDSTAIVNNEVVQLLSPLNNSYVNNSKVTFQWVNLASADKYIFEVISTPSFDTIVYNNKINKTLAGVDNSFQWRVTALTATGTKTSVTYIFHLDRVNPNIPVLFTQADTLLTPPAILRWQRKDSDVSYDSLFIYLSDQTTLMTGFPKRVNASYFKLDNSLNLNSGNYYWGIKSVDRANNVSTMPNKRKFIVR
ncbi:hypothetical protein [Adhaeribacter soli]|uniref:Uncharacterized protein n=1 Tax=Adhaeribacter soli TaxID=2607655 RepID=A0A5N1II18_9BACT|nr:hypothetical protein [Adhaeribacter soli]KAA9324919.1 hypothetical protein F0P94_19530 [Adhaeribacter soli]